MPTSSTATYDHDGEQPAVAHTGERRVGVDVAEEHEVAQVQRQRRAR